MARALTLTHFFPSFGFGGQQRRFATLVDGLGDNFRHRVFSLDGDLSAATLVSGRRNVDIAALKLRKTPLVSPGNIRWLKRAIVDSEGDLLCTYNFGSIEAAIANRFGPNIPHVHHEDGFGPDETARRSAKRAIARRLLLSRARIAVPSIGLEKIALTEWGADGRVARITPGIDLSRFHVERVAHSGPVVVGAIGALRREKNYARLIRCFEKASDGKGARLVIYGEGPERASLEEFIRRSQAHDRISLAGATATPESELANVDIFALSSDTEQTPIGMMEAMASGLPVIATDVGDIRLMLDATADRNVFATSDESAYAARLASLIDDARLRREIGEVNAARAAAFDKNAMIAAFEKLYRATAELS